MERNSSLKGGGDYPHPLSGYNLEQGTIHIQTVGMQQQLRELELMAPETRFLITSRNFYSPSC